MNPLLKEIRHNPLLGRPVFGPAEVATNNTKEGDGA
jgi:hypothetical protein